MLAYLYFTDRSLNMDRPEKNPFTKRYFNLTEQSQIYKASPELAKQLDAEAKDIKATQDRISGIFEKPSTIQTWDGIVSHMSVVYGESDKMKIRNCLDDLTRIGQLTEVQPSIYQRTGKPKPRPVTIFAF